MKKLLDSFGFNPYSNGSSFFIKVQKTNRGGYNEVSILILMDLPFLQEKDYYIYSDDAGFNPYSNGSSFFIMLWLSKEMTKALFQSLF